MLNKIKTGFQTRLKDTDALKRLLFGFAYWLVLLLYLELLVHLSAYGMPDARIGFLVGFTAVFAGLVAVLISLLPKKAQFIVTVIVTVFFVVLYGSQMVYRFVFGTLYSVSQMQQGGAAITSFWRELLLTMWNNILWILALLLPLVALPFVRRLWRGRFAPSNALWRLGLVLVIVAVQFACIGCLSIGGTGYFSDHYFYHNEMTTTDQAAQRFGLLTAFRLDLFSSEPATADAPQDYYVPEPTPTEPLPTGSAGEQPKPLERNVLQIDFDKLAQLSDNEKHAAISSYVQSVPGTMQNEYTGMLADYNLILVCAESFATGAIHPELTPTLYKMANSGIVFNNFYNSYPNNTTDGEYALCMGLYPDSSRYKEVASFFASRNSYLPFCLGNLFRQQKGVESWGYHNYKANYYGRDVTHPNMGYTMKFAEKGMKFTTEWPASDLEMMEQTVNDYIGQEQFHAYYMTFSGHMYYSTGGNAMAYRNWDQVKHLDMSYASQCYIGCNIELDKAMAYLMEQLEQAGVADRTAIVLVGDHFPYGLTNGQYSELVGYPLDNFNKYKSSLLFWVGGMEETIVVDEYCCNVDILPTLLNLWGFSYDSRMLSGTDVFSDGTHVAVLNDMSFYTDKVWLNAGSGEVRYLVPEESLPENYVDNMVKLVQTKYNLAKDILNTAYYNHVFEQGDVKVGYNTWGTWKTPEELERENAAATKPTGPDATAPTGPDASSPTGPDATAPTGPETATPTVPPDDGQGQATEPPAVQQETEPAT